MTRFCGYADFGDPWEFVCGFLDYEDYADPHNFRARLAFFGNIPYPIWVIFPPLQVDWFCYFIFAMCLLESIRSICKLSHPPSLFMTLATDAQIFYYMIYKFLLFCINYLFISGYIGITGCTESLNICQKFFFLDRCILPLGGGGWSGKYIFQNGPFFYNSAPICLLV